LTVSSVANAASGVTYYWEHCGMLADKGYRNRWERKQNWYHKHNILPLEEGGGENGNSVVSQDDERGGINLVEIKKLIQRIKGT
jgi:hypothetical protein